MDNTLTLWGIGTSRTIRAHWALLELGLPYRIEKIRTRTPDTETDTFKKINPRQKIPVLQDDSLTIGESAAIVTYLAENYRNGKTILMPEQRETRAKYFEWMSFICMELDATSLYVLRRHWSLPKIYGGSPNANKVAGEYFTRMINAAEKMHDPNIPFLLDDGFSGIDILMTTTLRWAVDYNQNLPPVFEKYLSEMEKRPCFLAALEANQA